MQFFFTGGVAWTILALGIVNLLTGALILFSCRVVPRLPDLLKHPKYKEFYKYHYVLWWVFWPSVIIHATLAIIRFVASVI